MEEKEKEILKFKLGLTLVHILEENKRISEANKTKGISNHTLVTSFRKLAAASGIDFGSVQKISVGKIGPEYTTFIALVNALDKNMVTFGQYYEALTDKEILEYKKSLEVAKSERVKKKMKDSKKG